MRQTDRLGQPGRSGPDIPDIGTAGPQLRAARPEDCRRIAELFEISSDGVADYVWSQLRADYPGLSLLEIGERRYARENTAFSYQNCVVAERAGEVIGMLHAFVIEPAEGPPPEADAIDPVLRPYAELEVPGSLYISGLALLPGERGRGIGSRLLGVARERAQEFSCAEVSLICFAANAGARRLYEHHGFTVTDRRDIVPHPMIHATGEALLMTAPV
jgi:ribosomal protein S18 acetylase RimI-like enzyme